MDTSSGTQAGIQVLARAGECDYRWSPQQWQRRKAPSCAAHQSWPLRQQRGERGCGDDQADDDLEQADARAPRMSVDLARRSFDDAPSEVVLEVAVAVQTQLDELVQSS
jgi:hypothetical protein